MKIEIFSKMAAVVGGSTTWSGEVQSDLSLERVFRLFNRVDEHDEARLERYGYNLPSLSAGDYVTLDGVTYLVLGIGFKKITGDEDFALEHVRSALETE